MPYLRRFFVFCALCVLLGVPGYGIPETAWAAEATRPVAAQTARKTRAQPKKAVRQQRRATTTPKSSVKRSSGATSKNASGQRSQRTEREMSRAQSQKASVEKRLESLRRELVEKEARQEEANRELQKADQAISEANRRLRTLKTERSTVERRLRDLKRDGRSVATELTAVESRVEQIARAQYVHSRREHWQSLLEGSNPSALTLEAAQLRYLARAQVRALDALEEKRRSIRNVAAETESRQSELVRIARDEEKSRRGLLSDKRDRQAAASKLKREIASQQAAIDKLTKDQARLGGLIASIDKRLAAERASEAAERRKAEEAARRQPRPSVRQPAPGTSFAKLKGRLTRPVRGRTVAAFGSSRKGSAKWQGLLIRAPEGAEVAACAPGTVVFADWLRGYGNLVIIDHGGNYLSVYANNESIFKNVGDRVKQGETISSVGASGGDDEPGLYFEIRRGGKPVNPAPWLAR